MADSKYIADTLFRLSRSGLPAPRTDVLRGVSDILQETLRVAHQLEARELYAVERSAANAAADLRADTPDRFDRLVEAIMGTERRIYVEISAEDAATVITGLRGYFSVLGHGIAGEDIARYGFLVDVSPDRGVRFRVLHAPSRPVEAVIEDLGAAGVTWRSITQGLSASERRAVRRAFEIRPAGLAVTLDPRRHVGLSRREFEAMLERSTWRDDLFGWTRDALSRASGTRERGRILDGAWRMMRIRDMLSSEACGPLETRESMDHHLVDAAILIPLLAVLEADSTDLVATPRKTRDRRAGKAGRKRRETPAPQVDIEPRLSLVTLNLEDRDLQHLYDRRIPSGADTDANASGESGRHGEGAQKARHPVRGHLFLARNGKVVWRRPHWRGSLDRGALRRVVAPGHG